MSGEREWYAGVVKSYSSRRGHCVAYDNGEFRNEDLDDWDPSDFEVVGGVASAFLASSAERAARGPAGATSSTSPTAAASSVADPFPATATAAPVRRVSAQDTPRKRRRPVVRDDSSEDEGEGGKELRAATVAVAPTSSIGLGGCEPADAAAAPLEELLAVVQRLKDDDAPKTEVRLGGGWAVLWVPRANKSKTPGDWYAYRRDDPNRLYRSQRELLRALPVGRGCGDSNDRSANGDSASESSDVDSGNVDQRNIVTGRRHRAAAK